MKLIDPRLDPWHTAAAEPGAPVRLRPHLLLTLAQWRATRDAWLPPLAPDRLSARVPVGVCLDNDAELSDVVPDLHLLSLVVLQFPKWTDGRAYSQARLLRARHRYGGELRASGQVLADMLPLLARTGFDSAQLELGQDRATAERALGWFGGHYQVDARHALPWFLREAA
jgi:uncharacterized protein (DUF934 family)